MVFLQTSFLFFYRYNVIFLFLKEPWTGENELEEFLLGLK